MRKEPPNDKVHSICAWLGRNFHRRVATALYPVRSASPSVLLLDQVGVHLREVIFDSAILLHLIQGAFGDLVTQLVWKAECLIAQLGLNPVRSIMLGRASIMVMSDQTDIKAAPEMVKCWPMNAPYNYTAINNIDFWNSSSSY